MLKRKYTDEMGREYHTIDFVSEKERDRAERVVKAWDERIKTLFEMGHDLCENGRKLCEFGELDNITEGRVRMHVGGELIDWGQMLLFNAKDSPMDKMREEMDELIVKIKDALGWDEKFQEAISEMQKGVDSGELEYER